MASNIHYLLCFIVLVLFPCSTVAQTSRNISLGSSLTAKNDDNSSWPSPSGEFAFGFQQIVKDGFLLGIWFDKIPEKTIVWSANRDSLVPQGSKVELTSDGQFVLNDAKGNQIWSADVYNTGVYYAAMLDSGNFVLADQNSTYLWESFDHPTDTMLPTQSLKQNGILYARYTATNYSTGRFMKTLQLDGNLVLYTTYYPQYSAKSPYWASWSVAKNTEIGYQVIFNQSGFIYLTSKNGSILYTISANSIASQEFYQRATLDYDGVLRHYKHPKSSSASGGRLPLAWSTASFIPPNICLSLVEVIGGGACGYNSLCRLDDAGSTCLCPDGFSFFDPDDKLKGCKQDFVPQSCDAGDAPDEFDLKEMEYTNMPHLDYEFFKPVSEDWCIQNCLEDCFCVVAIFNNLSQCYKKGLPFSNGMIDPTITGTKAFIKKRNNNSTLKDGRANSQKKKDDSTLIIVGSVLLSSLGILTFILPLITYVVVSRMHSRKVPAVQPYQGMNLKYFTYEELKEATNEFMEELGRGASATVFKGVLACDEGKRVAVKILDAKVGESDLEFNAEVKAIGRTNHRNLVQLLGYCNEGNHRILVYEYMSNGTLATFLFGESRPNWNQRRQIALGVSKGLLYLHEECSNQVVHCDIKPQNILLDDSFTARISDFGLAKLLRLDQTRTITGIRGTKGYVAPEWFKNMPITAKVDVYSFGILLLEIICCRKKFDEETEDEDQIILADWVYDCYSQKKLHLLLEKIDEAKEDIKMMEKYVMIAMWCIQEDPSLRPTMKKTIHMLEGTVEVPIPPDPSSYTSSIFVHIR
ncbi:G-type lectin S-receptor-like serine/threonine-protein kinase LECRK2 [Argentina anserina]|uniref:G-type lectin S-receptor-like serine/threonine-protein kinase LECRK2 n=1 Tax=Argentina anserina TaxID=57926 RepID=UPI00217665CC|nr:G-type lectin S-receptor-like serine/threonine-protein kinase LECRK2 [Potentilla anserina]